MTDQRRFGRYLIVSELGRGAMGAVHLAKDQCHNSSNVPVWKERTLPVVSLKSRSFNDGRFPRTMTRSIFDEATAGGLTMGEIILQPGASVPPHRHRVEEAFFVVVGEVTCVCDGDECTASAGDGILAPAGSVHSLRNESEADARLVYFYPTMNIWAEYPEQVAGE